MATARKKTTAKAQPKVAEQPKVEAPKTVKAVMRITWPGLGKVGEIIELTEKLAGEYVSLGVVDTAPAAIRTATKSK